MIFFIIRRQTFIFYQAKRDRKVNFDYQRAIFITQAIIFFFDIQLLLQFYFEMGQTNMQKIQSSIVNLTERDQISRQQAEFFVNDYVGSGQNINDINYFIQNESVDLFLKYFINATYPSPKSQTDANGNAQERTMMKLTNKIVQTGCLQLEEKIRVLFSEMMGVYLSEKSEILCLREKIKDMLIFHLQIQSYRYYCYKGKTMRETNSKILYLYETPAESTIYKYASSLEKQRNESASKLEDIVKERYLNYQNFCFQFYQRDTLHIVVLEINLEKWKYNRCASEGKIKKILNNIFCLFVENTIAIFDPQKKMSSLESKNIFSLFILALIQNYAFLQSKRVQFLLNQVNLSLSQKQMCKSERIEEIRQIILHKIRKWRHYFLSKKKILVLCYNQNRTLEFIYMNDESIFDFSVGRKEIGELNKSLNYFFNDDRKAIKKILKACGKRFDEQTIQVNSNVKAFITHSSSHEASCLTLQFLSQTYSESKQIQMKTQIEVLVEKDKALIKRVKADNPNLNQMGWFKSFLKEENENIPESKKAKRKNNIKLPKLNRKYRISTFKSLYSMEELREEIDVDNEDVNLLQFGPGRLEIFVLKVFSKLPFFCTLPHENDEFPNFLREIHENYQKHNNKFHNFIHGVNVMHTCYLLCSCKRNDSILTQFDKFIIIFSGLCHDVGHTGFTNLFQIARESELALTYNNKSPLEMFHASKTFEILKKTANNFLNSLSQSEFSRFRQLTISSILYTDVKEHFNLMKKFQTQKEFQKGGDISILAGMIIHASDFGGSVKKFQVCKAWSLLVNHQFSNQYAEEGRLGLPQTPFMKDLDKMNILAKNESGFLKVIVHPLYKELSGFYEEKATWKMVKNVQGNIKEWEKLMIKQQEKPKGVKPKVEKLKI